MLGSASFAGARNPQGWASQHRPNTGKIATANYRQVPETSTTSPSLNWTKPKIAPTKHSVAPVQYLQPSSGLQPPQSSPAQANPALRQLTPPNIGNGTTGPEVNGSTQNGNAATQPTPTPPNRPTTADPEVVFEPKQNTADTPSQNAPHLQNNPAVQNGPLDDDAWSDPLYEWQAGKKPVEERECPDMSDLKSIRELTYKIAPKPGTLPRECPIQRGQYTPRQWAPTTVNWKASSLCRKPVYFEDPKLSRYGHSAGPILQPALSGARFFLTAPALPYLMGLYPPQECVYTLGYYRPGSCAPYMLDPLPISVRAGLMQAGAVTGAVYLIP